jgi:hypothetical protein
MARGLAVLACTALILLGTAANIAAGPRKTAAYIGATTNTSGYQVPAYVDISGIFLGH